MNELTKTYECIDTLPPVLLHNYNVLEVGISECWTYCTCGTSTIVWFQRTLITLHVLFVVIVGHPLATSVVLEMAKI